MNPDTLDHRKAWGAGLAAAALILGGCSLEEVPAPGPSRIDVDTPELREQKAEAGVEDCAEGPGGALPALTLACLGGGPDVDLSTLRGPLVINFWASWCDPCREEMPVIQEFYERHGDEVAVLGVNYQDKYPEAAIALASETGVTYPQLADPGGETAEVQSLYSQGIPYFILVDERGEIAYKVAQVAKSPDDIVALVNEHLGTDL